ncbi:ATP-binding protein [Aliikangiella sp. G2MR2-5]|uniref:ATP-binding protein n=1 Tax=Aliikangiella sp. G2MR2-5 TaxID=2788943 RepID=UPI0018AA8818|nr:ATP-binding protein [Aliikangiella sp. G2MR2-5]
MARIKQFLIWALVVVVSQYCTGIVFASPDNAIDLIDPFAPDKPTFNIPDDFYGRVPFKHIQFLAFPSAQYTDTQILSGIEKGWQDLPENFSPDPKTTYWFRVRIETAQQQKHWLVTPGLWHKSQAFVRNEQGKWNSFNTSVFTPVSERQYPSHWPMLVLDIPDEGITLIFKNQGFRFGRDPIAQQIQLFSEPQYLKQVASEERVQGGYMGFAIAIAGFHLVLWIWFREKTYLWLVVAMIGGPVFYHALLGLGFTDLWPEWPVWNEYSSSLLAAVIPALYLRFGASYLNIGTYLPKVNRIVIQLFYLILASSLAVFYQGIDLLFIQAILTTLASILLLVSSIYLALRGKRYAWYFVAGNGIILLVLFFWPFLEIGNIAMDDLPFSIVSLSQFGSAWQGILLALGMVDRMQSMKQTLLKRELDSERQAVKHAQQTRALIQAQNEELESSNKALKELDDMKDEFLARTSHELNTPLNGIIGLSQVLLDEEIELRPNERKEYIELIAQRSEHLKELVSELLEFVKTRKEVINLYKEKIDISSHIAKIVLTFQPQAENKGLYLKLLNSIPVIVNADPRRMRQVLTILLDNALKYTDQGGVKVSIEPEESSVVIKVTDTGIGISEEHRNTIFEPFKQLKQNNKTREGAGLGLSICKHLIELHGGSMSIESKIGKGSCFSISLPKK